jgi:hypothetical protein
MKNAHLAAAREIVAQYPKFRPAKDGDKIAVFNPATKAQSAWLEVPDTMPVAEMRRQFTVLCRSVA